MKVASSEPRRRCSRGTEPVRALVYFQLQRKCGGGGNKIKVSFPRFTSSIGCFLLFTYFSALKLNRKEKPRSTWQGRELTTYISLKKDIRLRSHEILFWPSETDAPGRIGELRNQGVRFQLDPVPDTL